MEYAQAALIQRCDLDVIAAQEHCMHLFVFYSRVVGGRFFTSHEHAARWGPPTLRHVEKYGVTMLHALFSMMGREVVVFWKWELLLSPSQ